MRDIDETHYGARIDGGTYRIQSSGFHAIVEPWPTGIDGLGHHPRAAGMASEWLAFNAWVPAAGLAEFVATPAECSACKGDRKVWCNYCDSEGCEWCDEEGRLDCRTCTHRPSTFLGKIFNRALVNDVIAELGGVDMVGLYEEPHEEGRVHYYQLVLRRTGSPCVGVVMSMRDDVAEPVGSWP